MKVKSPIWASKESAEINSGESLIKTILQFQKYLNIESDTSLAFGRTKIIVTDDKKLSAKADRLIGITIDEDGTAKIYTIAIAQGDFERL